MLAIARTLERPVSRAPRAHSRVSRSPWAERVAAAAVVVGGAVRVEEFLWRRSLWLDEALVVNNIVSRGYVALLHPLSGEQGAPLGWLWVQRTMVTLFGANEYALRLVPLAAGIAALALVHWLARHVLGPWPAALATWILALSPQAVRYSVEVKQYSTDLAISAALLFLALQAVEHRVVDGRQDRRAIIGWGWLGAIAVWWSHPAIFVIAGTAVVLAFDAARTRAADGGASWRLVLRASIPWLVSFALDWLVSLRRLGRDPFLHSFWAAGFPPTPVRPTSLLSWLVRAPSHLPVDPGGIPMAGVAALLAAVGLGAASVRRRVPGAMITMPLLVAVGAALVGAYPLRGRLALWLLPVLVVGLAGLLVTTKEVKVLAAVVVALVLLVHAPAHQVLNLVHHPTTFQDTRPLLQAVHRRLQPGDQIWVHAEDNAAARFYALSTGAALTHELHDEPSDLCVGNPDLRAVGAGHRVWFVYAYHGSDAPADEEVVLVAHLRAAGHLESSLRRPSAAAYLLDFGAGPDLATASPSDIPCISVSEAPPVRPTGLHAGPFGLGSGL
ncbi:MAG: glycosyltransferase family 39 protein [Acidimicrobiales bacterium]